jgi:predicted nucleic acid-binding Zn ribbon protein
MTKKSYRSPVHRRQRVKNFALLFALVAFVVIVFFVSLVRMGGL